MSAADLIEKTFKIAVIGAGPSGLFAAEKLASQGYAVAVFNRDIKPGGMVEYGIFPDKHGIRAGLHRQFEQILANENILYFGNAVIGRKVCISLDDLREWGFKALLIACGAQGTKWLGLPGEKLPGVFHAKDLVYHYNRLPSHSKRDFLIGKRVAIIGGGNVMTDIAHYLVKYRQVEQIFILVRRGPAEVKFEKKELEAIFNNLDLEDLEEEFSRVSALMKSLGQDPDVEKEFILSAREKAHPREGNTSIRMRFLVSPLEILGEVEGKVTGLIVEENTLEQVNENVVARASGITREMVLDTVIFAIGDNVDDELGLPLDRYGYKISTNPAFPISGESYELAGDENGRSIPGLFVTGWARHPSSGLVGHAKKDGIYAATAIQTYLESLRDREGITGDELVGKVASLVCQLVQKEHLLPLKKTEEQMALQLGVEKYKFATNEEMMRVMGLSE